MKVILLKDTGGVGSRHDVKEVKPGFARNFLIPRGYAEVATTKGLNRLEALKKTHEAEKEKYAKEVKKALKKLSGKPLQIKVPANTEGVLYAGIDASQLSLVLHNEAGVSIPEEGLKLETPIKTTGEHAVKISYGGEEGEVVFKIEAQK